MPEVPGGNDVVPGAGDKPEVPGDDDPVPVTDIEPEGREDGKSALRIPVVNVTVLETPAATSDNEVWETVVETLSTAGAVAIL